MAGTCRLRRSLTLALLTMLTGLTTEAAAQTVTTFVKNLGQTTHKNTPSRRPARASIDLAANTQYWVVMDAIAIALQSDAEGLALTSSNNEDAGAASG